MAPEIIELIGNVRKRRSQKFRRQFSVFLICLLVSVFLWSLVKLSRDYYYTVDYSLNFTNIPPSYKLISSSDSLLTVSMKVQGYDFFTEKLFPRDTRTYAMDLSSIKVKGKSGEVYGFLLTAPMGYDIASQSRYRNHLLSTTPDTIFFRFERRR